MLNPLTRLWKNRDGLAAVEFAFVLPVMITLFMGIVELDSALAARADVTSMASTAADLIAQESQVTNADMTNVFSALNEMLYPYATTATANGKTTSLAQITISSIIDNGSGGGKVAWSDTQGGTARTVGSAVSVPAGLIVSGGSVILAEIRYNYSSPTSRYVVGTVSMTNSFYAKPRRISQIARVAS